MADPVPTETVAVAQTLATVPQSQPTDAKRSRDRATIWLAYLVVIGFFGYVISITFLNAKLEKDIELLVLGYLSAQFTQVVSFFFGSSASSATKDEKAVARS